MTGQALFISPYREAAAASGNPGNTKGSTARENAAASEYPTEESAAASALRPARYSTVLMQEAAASAYPR